MSAQNRSRSDFPPETSINGMFPGLPFIQSTSLSNMEIENSFTGNGILIDQSGSPAETKTFGASNIAPDITNCKLDPKVRMSICLFLPPFTAFVVQ